MIINATTLKYHLRHKGLTQKALADRAGVSPKTVSRIMNDEELRPSNAEKIAKALGVTLHELQSMPSAELAANAEKKGDLQRLVADIDIMHINSLTMTALRYNVTKDEILSASPYVFTLLAELCLKRRKDKVEVWREGALAALAGGPVALSYDLGIVQEGVWELYHEDMQGITKHSLTGGCDGELPEYRKDRSRRDFQEFLEELSQEAGLEYDFNEREPKNFVPFSSTHNYQMWSEFFGGVGGGFPEDIQLAFEQMDFEFLYNIPHEIIRGTPAERCAWLRSHSEFSGFLGATAASDEPAIGLQSERVAFVPENPSTSQEGGQNE